MKFDTTIDSLHRVLDLRAEQHALTAGNLANTDTPGYRAKVIPFDTALTEAMAGESHGVRLQGTDPRHFAADLGDPGAPDVVEIEPPPWAEDGNSVFAERETARLVGNQLVYGGVVRGLSKHLAMLRYAASDGR